MRGVAWATAVAIMATVGSGSASATTVVTGDRDTNAALVIDPSSNATDPLTKATALSFETVLFIQRMPVTKRINKVTIGDLGLGPGCSSGTVEAQIHEHPSGDWTGDPTTRFYSSNAPALPATPGKVSWSFPASTLRKGHGYAFRVQTFGCTTINRTTWAHNGTHVNGGPVPCEQGPTDSRMWHVAGVDDASWGCVTNGTSTRKFHKDMPGGWLITRPNPYAWDVMTGTSLNSAPNPTCGYASQRNPDDLGGAGVVWRPSPTYPTTHSDYACYWTQFGPPDTLLEDGWYYALPWLTERDGAPRDMYLKLETIDYDAKLAAHAPIVVNDSDELFQAISPAAATDFYDASQDPDDPLESNRLVDSTGAFAYANPDVAGQEDGDVLDLNYLAASYSGSSRRAGGAEGTDVLSERGSGDPLQYADDAAWMTSQSGYNNRVYGRVTHDDLGNIWLQYWLFYYADPQINAFGSGLHEGDWELVQVRLDASMTPDQAAYAQHGGGERCSWPAVESSGGHPLVFVAEDSHASYFHAGTYFDPTPDDDADGGDVPLQPTVVQIKAETTAWINWPGRWGDSGSSPVGPMFQSVKWNSPGAWADQLTPCGEVG